MLVLVYQRVVPLLVFSNPMRSCSKSPVQGPFASVLFDGLEPQSHSEIPAVALDASSVLVVNSAEKHMDSPTSLNCPRENPVSFAKGGIP